MLTQCDERTTEGGGGENIDRTSALERMLEIRPDYAAALRERWLIEMRSGSAAAANGYLARLRRVSPLDPALPEHLE